jgi:hypothetical protein
MYEMHTRMEKVDNNNNKTTTTNRRWVPEEARLHLHCKGNYSGWKRLGVGRRGEVPCCESAGVA